MLKNLSFEEVDHVPLLTALKREAQFPGWLPQDVAGDDRYRGLQSLCNDIIQSATGTGHPVCNLIRNRNPGPTNGFGDTQKMFVASAQAWEIIRVWLRTEGINRNWW